MKTIRTNVAGFVQDVNTRAILSNEESYNEFVAARERVRRENKTKNEIQELKQNFGELKNDIDELKSLILKVVNG